MLAGESATTIARSPAGWSSACSIASIPPQDWPTIAYRPAIPRCRVSSDELVLEELRRPEVGGRVGEMLAPAAAELVVEDAAAAGPGEIGDRLAVVVRRAGAAVADDDGVSVRPRIELAHHAVPRLVTAPPHASFVLGHRQLLLGGIGE